MKKHILIGISLIVIFVITGCTGSTYPRTDQQIEGDCLKIQPIQSNLVELRDFEINSKYIGEEIFVVKATITLKTDLEVVKAEVIMNYKKHDKVWYVDTSDIKINEVVTTQIPNIDLVKQKLATFKLLLEEYDAHSLLIPVTVTDQPYDNSGKIIFSFFQEGDKENWIYKTEGKVTAIYDLNKRWQLSINNDVYSEATIWEGNYELLRWNTPNQIGVPDIRVPLTLFGECKMTRNGTNVITDCQVAGKFTIDGTVYEIAGIMNPKLDKPNTRNIVFKYGVAENQYIGISIDFFEENGQMYHNLNGLIGNEYAFVLRIN
ncbi:MAG: hypothetical protein FD179_311 [Erysipelotrichaceae bacterium]|nr:MAG: hypothetical protein FD179_311 [Erysipelotrichaceae bacterium]